MDRPGDVHDAYDIEDSKLGEGTFAVVRKATRRHSKGSREVVRAIKTVAKQYVQDVAEFKREVEVMKVMDHPNIIKLFETFENKRNIYLVMELCEGGELFARILEAGRFSEREAAIVMQQVLRAVFYMHEHNITHRDLKPENFLFMTTEPIETNVLKLIDFGLACHSTPGKVHRAFVGTPGYVSPQVVTRRYDRQCDLWSCGVIMYILLSGSSPFGGANEKEVIAKVRQGQINTSSTRWHPVSADAKDLIRQLLKRNPAERYNAEQALSHPWIKHTALDAEGVSLEEGFVASLRSFRLQNELKKAALHVIADQLNNAETKKIRETFSALDTAGCGVLTLANLKDGLSRAGLQDVAPDLQQLLDGADILGSEAITYSEFLAAMLDNKHHLQEEVCRTAFNVFDLDGDGRISQKELLKLISGEVAQDTGETLDFEDFMTIVRTEGADNA